MINVPMRCLTLNGLQKSDGRKWKQHSNNALQNWAASVIKLYFHFVEFSDIIKLHNIWSCTNAIEDLILFLGEMLYDNFEGSYQREIRS